MDYLHVLITCIYGRVLRLSPGTAPDSFAPPSMDPDDLRPRTTRGSHGIPRRIRRRGGRDRRDRVRSRHVADVGLTDGTLTSLAAGIRHAVSARTNRFERAHRTLGR